MDVKKIAIVDDSDADRKTLTEGVGRFLHKHGIEMEIDLYESGEAFLMQYAPGLYRIIILDIFMGKLTGMQIAERIRAQEDDCGILFATTSEEFAVQSYEVRAAYYLLKPVDEKKLEKGLSLCLKEELEKEPTIQVTANRLPLEISYPAVYYAETHRNVLEIHLKDRVIKTYMTFQNLMDLLDGDRRFLICNKGCVVNMDHILQMEEYDFILQNYEKVPIRKRGNSQVKMEYLQYACEKLETD